MKIYHLLSTDHAINNIALKRIKIARYSDLNDPFELMAGDLSKKELRDAVTTLKRDFNNDRGLVCFSKSWHNPVLWSHYADKHRGIALGFDIKDSYLSHIKYSNTRLPLKFKNDDPNNGLDPRFTNDLLYTKYKHWEYEEETRVHVDIKGAEDEGGLFFTDFHDIGITLKEVVLGHSCVLPLEIIRTLVNVNYNDIKITKARLAFKEFKVVIDQRYEK